MCTNIFTYERVRRLDFVARSRYIRSVLFTTRVIRKRTPTILTGADYSRSFANIVNIRARFYTW